MSVPEFYVKFYQQFEHVLPRAERDHVAASDGFCRSCFKPWPCDIAMWVHELLDQRRTGLHGKPQARNPQLHLS